MNLQKIHVSYGVFTKNLILQFENVDAGYDTTDNYTKQSSCARIRCAHIAKLEPVTRKYYFVVIFTLSKHKET